MKHFPYRHCRVTIVFQMFWQGDKVSDCISPVAVEVVQFQSVWPSTGQERVSTRCA